MFVGHTAVLGHFIEHLEGLGDHTSGRERPYESDEEVGGLLADCTRRGGNGDHGAAGGGREV